MTADRLSEAAAAIRAKPGKPWHRAVADLLDSAAFCAEATDLATDHASCPYVAAKALAVAEAYLGGAR